MIRKFMSMLLTMTMIFTLLAVNVQADVVQCKVSVGGCSFISYSEAPTDSVESYYSFRTNEYNNVVYSLKGEDDDWNVKFSFDKDTQERKLVVRDLKISTNSNFIEITDTGFAKNFVLEFQGENVFTSTFTYTSGIKYFIYSGGKIDIKGTSGSSLRCIKSTGKIDGIYTNSDLLIDNMTINMNLGADIAGIHSSKELVIRGSKIRIDMISNRSNAAGIFTMNGDLTVEGSNIDIEINASKYEVSNKTNNPLIGIVAKNHSYKGSSVRVYIKNNGYDAYGVTKSHYFDYAKTTDGAIVSEGTNFEIRFEGGGLRRIGIGGNSLDITGGEIALGLNSSYKQSLGLVSWGWTSWENHTLNGQTGNTKLTGVVINFSNVQASADVNHMLSFQGDLDICNSRLEQFETESDRETISVYIGKDLIETGKNTFVCIADGYGDGEHYDYGIYFDNRNDGDVIKFAPLDKVKIQAAKCIYSNASINVVFGEHNEVKLDERKFDVNDNISYEFDAKYTGTTDSSIEEETKLIVVANPHYYSKDCLDRECDYEGCDEIRTNLSHTYEGDSTVCLLCDYISEISITGIDQPVAGNSLDTNAEVNPGACCSISNVSWTNGTNAVTSADYETSYTASIALTIEDEYWINDDTKIYVDGEEAAISSEKVISYTFAATEKEPTPTPTAEPTNTPTSTPAATPSSTPVVTPTVVPTSAPTSAPTTAPTVAPSKSVGDFVNRCYDVALGRSADSAGYDYWVNALNGGEACGAQVGYGFIFSAEYINKERSDEEFVTDLYSMYFDRDADEGGFNYWVDLLRNGASREDILAGFANSLEFYNLCSEYGVVQGLYLVGVPNAQQGGINCFVARLYKVCFDRLPDMGGQSGWVLKLYNGEVTGTSCAYGFVFSPEFIGKEPSNEEFVNYMYAAFFGREADEGGFNAWVQTLNDGGSYEDVFNGFTGSAEFYNLCGEYGINA